MLDVEFCEHRIQPRSIRIDVDHIRRDVATLALELFDLLAVGAQYLIRGSIRRQVGRRFPAFVVYANPREVVSHLAVFAERTIFIGESKDSHDNYLQAQAARESCTLCRAGANQHFEQELQDFNVALGFLQARTPSIKPMLPQEKTMDAGALYLGCGLAGRQHRNNTRLNSN